MDDDKIIAVAAILLCALLNFFFTLAEASLWTMGRLRMGSVHPREAAEHGADTPEGAQTHHASSDKTIHELLASPTHVIAAVQLAITIIGLTSLAIALTQFAPGLTDFFSRWMARHLAHTAAVAVLVMIIAIINLTLCEIVPRAVALRYPHHVAKLVSVPLKWLEWIERPVVTAMLALSNAMIKPFGLTATFHAAMMTEEELRVLFDAGQSEGVIEEDEKEMLHNVISFGDTQTHEVMTPRVDIRAIEVGQPLQKLIDLIVDHGHSRIPVYEGTIDTVIGVVHAKDLLPGLAGSPDTGTLRAIMRAPTFVPEHLPIDDLLRQMRRSNTQLAIVQDEYGGTAGLVTIEDLLEEIVGEIQDEYDPEQTMVVTDLRTGASLVDARMPIDDVNEELNLSLPTVDFDTIGGLVFGLIGRPPEAGDTVETTVGADGELTVRFQVTKSDGRRLQQVSIESFPTPSETEAEAREEKPVAAE